jgi:Protein of unknown function (DUF2442)
MKLIWVTKVEYIKDFELYLEFNDSTKGTVNLENKLKGPIFEELSDINYFKKFNLDSWTISWPNGADLAPEFLYELTLQCQKGIFSS